MGGRKQCVDPGLDPEDGVPDAVANPAYVLREVLLTDQLRIARSFVQTDVAIVAGPNRLTVARSDAPHRMERLVGHGL